MTTNADENPIVCLNYCMVDYTTGYCLTCGRPPIPVSAIDLNPKSFAGISLKGLDIPPDQGKTQDETS